MNQQNSMRYCQEEIVHLSPEGGHRVLSMRLKEDALSRNTHTTKQVIITIDGKVYDLPDQLKDVPDNTVFRALSASAYADDFVGPPRPVMRGELGKLLGFKIYQKLGFPYVPPFSPPKREPPKPKGPKKHGRRW